MNSILSLTGTAAAMDVKYLTGQTISQPNTRICVLAGCFRSLRYIKRLQMQRMTA